jgi:hypothetical protein
MPVSQSWLASLLKISFSSFKASKSRFICYYAPCHSALMIHRTPLQVKKYNMKCMKRGTKCIYHGRSGLPFCRKEGRINDNGKER